jgi:hypothetical protein
MILFPNDKFPPNLVTLQAKFFFRREFAAIRHGT